MYSTPYPVHIFTPNNGQIYLYSIDNIGLNTYNNLLVTKNWQENKGNTAKRVLTVTDSEHRRHNCCGE